MSGILTGSSRSEPSSFEILTEIIRFFYVLPADAAPTDWLFTLSVDLDMLVQFLGFKKLMFYFNFSSLNEQILLPQIGSSIVFVIEEPI